MKRFLITFIISFFLFSPLSYAQETSSYNEARKYFEQQGILKSETAGKDNQRMAKAEFFKILLESTGYNPDPKIRFIPTPYQDVDPKSWYAPYIQKAYRLGLIGNVDKLNPAQGIRTMEAMRMILELEGYTVPKVYNQDFIAPYRDLISQDDKRIASKILELNVYTPRQQNLFGANNFIKRSEVIELLYRFHLITEADKTIFTPEEATPNITIQVQPKTNLPELEYLESVRDQVFSKYYKSPDLDEQKLMDAAIEGYVKGLNDKYSVYFPPKDSEDFNQTLDGSYEGIGAYLEETDEGIVILSPIKDSPAEKAGVEAGDIIKKVDGIDVVGMKMEDVVRLIKGPQGSVVTIEFERKGKILPLKVIRAHIEIHSVTAEEKDGVLIISMHQFGAKTLREFSDIFNEYKPNDYRGIVLDLRSNPGGFLNVAEDILSYWIEENQPIVALQYRDHKEDALAGKNQMLSKVKTAILINKASASASEIVAGTLKDYQKARLFGETSFGKGTVQELIQYRNGAMLKITVAEWLTGKGNSINEKGVVPHVSVVDNESTKNDEVIDAALNWVKN